MAHADESHLYEPLSMKERAESSKQFVHAFLQLCLLCIHMRVHSFLWLRKLSVCRVQATTLHQYQEVVTRMYHRTRSLKGRGHTRQEIRCTRIWTITTFMRSSSYNNVRYKMTVLYTVYTINSFMQGHDPDAGFRKAKILAVYMYKTVHTR